MSFTRKKIATNELIQKAEAGDTDAQKALGLLYELGLSVDHSYEKSLQYWKKAAMSGDGWAALTVGGLTDKGLGTAKNPTEREKWLAVAEKSGYVTGAKKKAWIKAESRIAPIETKGKVLVVDDDKSLLELIVNILSQDSFQVISANNGAEALAIITKNPDIQIIFTDLIMPQMSGLQLIKTLRRMEILSDAASVIMTGFPKPEYIAAAKKLQVTRWLNKPFTQEVLLATANSLLKKKKSA